MTKGHKMRLKLAQFQLHFLQFTKVLHFVTVLRNQIQLQFKSISFSRYLFLNTGPIHSHENKKNMKPFHIDRELECPILFNPKRCGGGQNDPLVRRSPAISHRIMLWSQKFLTLSINISTRRY